MRKMEADSFAALVKIATKLNPDRPKNLTETYEKERFEDSSEVTVISNVSSRATRRLSACLT